MRRIAWKRWGARSAVVIAFGVALVLLVRPGLAPTALADSFTQWRLARRELARFRAAGTSAEREAAVNDLTSLGPAGRAALEEVAFSKVPAAPTDPGLALRELAFAKLDFLDEESLRRLLLEGVGVRRHFWGFPGRPYRREAFPRLEEAIERTALIETDECAVDNLGTLMRELDLTALLERVARASPNPRMRWQALEALELACADWARRPTDGLERALRLALGDTDPLVRRHAAVALVRRFGDRAGLAILLDALAHTPAAGSTPWGSPCVLGGDVALALAALGERRAIRALVNAPPASRGAFQVDVALHALTGEKLETRARWRSWFVEHQGELPPQLDERGEVSPALAARFEREVPARIERLSRAVEGDDAQARAMAAETLAFFLGEPGIAAVESIAFSREIALPSSPRTRLRQATLDALIARDRVADELEGSPWYVRVARSPSTRARSRRYITEARGLDRREFLRRHATDSTCREDVEEAVATDPDAAVVLDFVNAPSEWLGDRDYFERSLPRVERALALFRRALENPDAAVRRRAIERIQTWSRPRYGCQGAPGLEEALAAVRRLVDDPEPSVALLARATIRSSSP